VTSEKGLGALQRAREGKEEGSGPLRKEKKSQVLAHEGGRKGPYRIREREGSSIWERKKEKSSRVDKDLSFKAGKKKAFLTRM